MTVVADRVTTVSLPTRGRALPPVTARKFSRLALTYAIFWVVGALPGKLGLSDAWVAAGLGLALPGGGFLYGGHPGWAVVSLVAVVLAIFTGIFCIGAGIFRLGFIADFLSKPILIGFLNGIAIHIFIGQIGKEPQAGHDDGHSQQYNRFVRRQPVQNAAHSLAHHTLLSQMRRVCALRFSASLFREAASNSIKPSSTALCPRLMVSTAVRAAVTPAVDRAARS